VAVINDTSDHVTSDFMGSVFTKKKGTSVAAGMLILQFSSKVEHIWFLKSLRYQKNVSAG